MTLRNPISITLPQSCPEDWSQMTPEGAGRFCAACSKTVTDFTAMTDTQIINFIKTTGQSQGCGRFTAAQLDRQLVAAPPRGLTSYPFFNKIAASFIMFQALATAAIAQTAKPKTHASPHHSGTKKAATKFIHGKVVDIATGNVLSGMIVNVSGTPIKATTDAKGCFYIALPANAHDAVELAVTYGETAGPAPAGTLIANKTITPAELHYNSGITIYRYSPDTLSGASVSSHPITRELRDITAITQSPRASQGAYSSIGEGGRRSGTLYVIDGVVVDTLQAPQAHKNLWQRMTGVFRKKNKN